jgi:predicted RNA binding protein YcfA (HicA-like mRNA interferase family)
VLTRHGWYLLRTSRHHIFAHPSRNGRVPVPNHGNKTLGLGLQRKIMRDAGLTDADL